MRKFLLACVLGMSVVVSANANDLSLDSSDPLFLLGDNNILTQTSVAYWDHILRFGEILSYGINNRFAISANVHYQHDFNGGEDGFSAMDVGGVYRMATADDTQSKIISDVLFGFKFGGSSHVRTPYYADSTYYAGLRVGRQWAGMTLAATIKSSWIFDDVRGMSYIDFVPEAYFRIAPDWRIGGGLTIRKATNKDPQTGADYDQEWLHTKLVRQYGRTQYVGHLDYEFESDDVQVGARVNVLF